MPRAFPCSLIGLCFECSQARGRAPLSRISGLTRIAHQNDRTPATAAFGRTGFLARPVPSDGLGSPSYDSRAQSGLTLPPRLKWTVALALVLAFPLSAQPAGPPVFEKDVLPILQAKCLRCHGAQQHKAALDLRSRAAMIHGGESGPALLAGVAEKSLLWIRIAGDQMPPGKEKLSAAEKGTLKVWIDSGARATAADTPVPAPAVDRQIADADRQFWAFQPPTRPPVPVVKDKQRVRNAVDAFILAALEKKGLTLSPRADRPTLLRRASFDLIGLPATPAEIDAFVADQSADAFDKQIDRLLASPRYGERWGRHWLDLAGYADSEGILDADYRPTAAWRYRDFVIRAFNADLPYDRFLEVQIAGDEAD